MTVSPLVFQDIGKDEFHRFTNDEEVVHDVKLFFLFGISCVPSNEYDRGVLQHHEAEQEEAEGGTVRLEVEHAG